MPFSNQQIVLIVIIVILTGILLILFGSIINQSASRSKKRKLLKENREHGAEGEEKAKAYLLKEGFTIVKEQVHVERQMIIDNEPHSFTLRADFLVEKNNETAIVDAKSGCDCVKPSNIATRRQLLEYFTCYDVDKVYVYNSIEDKLVSVVFADDNQKISKAPKRVSYAYAALIFLVLQLIVIAIISRFL